MTDHDLIREWLRSLDKRERKVVKSEVAKWNNEARRVHAGGRPKVLKPCPKCGASFGARELAKHIPTCPALRKALLEGSWDTKPPHKLKPFTYESPD